MFSGVARRQSRRATPEKNTPSPHAGRGQGVELKTIAQESNEVCSTAHLTLPNLAGTTGFEPAISTLTGSHPRPLDDVPRLVW